MRCYSIYHGSARECIEHVKENEAREGHCGVTGGDLPIRGHFPVEYEESARDDSKCRD